MKKLYAALAILGFLLPMSQLFGMDLGTFFGQALANPVSRMLTFDLAVSCVIFWIFVFTQAVRHRWLYVVLTLLVGLSFALPMFLLARERSRA